MTDVTITYIMFLVFTGTAILSTFALYTRQSLLVAYIVLGAILGPYGLKFVVNATVIQQAGNIGIIFLLFLLGLHLQPQSVLHSLRKMSLFTVITSLIFFFIGFGITYAFDFGVDAAIIAGIAAMFSSTIIGLKLLPTTILHHQHTGELVISVLLLQDILAIAAILVLEVIANKEVSYWNVMLIIVAFPSLLLIAYVFQKFVLTPLLNRFDKIHEYIFILSIGWCLSMAEVSHSLFGLSEEIGAFIAGVALASNPIALYIAESLKPLRDFFLVLFFFTIGAAFNFDALPTVLVPASLFALTMLLIKPLVFSWFLHKVGEAKNVSIEIGIRLGQLSEFSLLIAFIAVETEFVKPILRNMIEAAVIMTFIVSCYWTVMRYPTPLASNDTLRRD